MRDVVRIVSLATACVGMLFGDEPMSPQATRLEPKVAKPGTVITITGVALGKSDVAEVFLTDHRFDMKVKVLEQTDEILKIRVPPFLKAGRQQLLFLSGGKSPAYLEQPVYLLIEIDEDATAAPAKTAPARTESAPGAGGDKASNSNHADKPN
jgi:hypothetical protein